mmetsp:Transcript_33894/g.118563  ORF Transcript_33894/g.118563 Transcript_33894/m.118563 type:complete len:216 (+) Transcript_33894:523-1170(+)
MRQILRRRRPNHLRHRRRDGLEEGGRELETACRIRPCRAADVSGVELAHVKDEGGGDGVEHGRGRYRQRRDVDGAGAVEVRGRGKGPDDFGELAAFEGLRVGHNLSRHVLQKRLRGHLCRGKGPGHGSQLVRLEGVQRRLRRLCQRNEEGRDVAVDVRGCKGPGYRRKLLGREAKGVRRRGKGNRLEQLAVGHARVRKGPGEHGKGLRVEPRHGS